MLMFTGGLKRKCIYFGEDHEPAMMIYRPAVLGRSSIIPLETAYRYDEPETLEDKADVLLSCRKIAEALDLPQDNATCAHISMFVADGLEELLRMKPYGSREKKAVGEFWGTVDGEKVSGEMLQ
jgi:hypothetical protein